MSMTIKSSLLVMAIAAVFSGPVMAAYEDHRTSATLPNVEAAFKAASVEDVASILVPETWKVSYQSPEQRQQKISLSGKGPWPALLLQGLQPIGLKPVLNHAQRTVTIVSNSESQVVPDAPLVSTSAVLAAPSGPVLVKSPVMPVVAQPVAVAVAVRAPEPIVMGKMDTSVLIAPMPARPAPLAAATNTTPAWLAAAAYVAPPRMFAVRATDGSISRTVQRWADEANMQLVWQEEDVDYPVKGETHYSTDLRSSLHDLLESTRNARTSLHACIHPNKPQALIRVIRGSERCDNQGAM